MKMRPCNLIASLTLAAASSAYAESPPLAAQALQTSFTTLITTPLVIEGLTSDSDGNLYAPGRATTPGLPCLVWRIPIDNPALTVVGQVPSPPAGGTCSSSGLAFGPDGNLYVTQTDTIYRFTPSAASPPTATVFATGVPGTNGLAFDRDGNLWTGDGTTGQGRVWKISPSGTTVTEMFRIPPMSNEVNLASGTGGIGRDVRTLGPGTITVTPTSRNAANQLGSQPLVANGLQFTRRGNLLVADTARGAIWGVRIRDGAIASPMGCDTTFTANTLCLSAVFIAHPMLEGADGIVLDIAGNIWVDANERNAVVFVSAFGDVIEVFRNPVDPATQLRNAGPLETPTSPVLVGHKLCTANSDGNRRDNFPNTAGEIGGSGQPRGKISCLDQRVNVPGVNPPVH